KACVLPENPASYRVVRTKSYLFNKAHKRVSFVSTRFLRYFNIYERDHKHISSWGQDSEQNARAAAADRMAETLCGARQ
ncbi:hypothetical protein OS118_08255, partial [Klebsiella pneumoniae]|uniref:hypothetical protein n=1 Tax=Klebsiella pneumoniae TaxID=573 RepID=UPI00237C39A6